MIARLEFNLPEETAEFRLVMNAGGYQTIVDELIKEVRGHRKHGHQFQSADEVLDWVWKRIWDMRQEEGITDDA